MSKLAFRIRKECFKQILLCRSSACAPCVASSSIFMSFPIFLGRYAKLLFKYFTLFCSLLKFKCLKNIFWRFCAKIKLKHSLYFGNSESNSDHTLNVDFEQLLLNIVYTWISVPSWHQRFKSCILSNNSWTELKLTQQPSIMPIKVWSQLCTVWVLTVFTLWPYLCWALCSPHCRLQTGEEDGRHQSWPGDLSWAVRGGLQRWQPAASRSPVCSLQWVVQGEVETFCGMTLSQCRPPYRAPCSAVRRARCLVQGPCTWVPWVWVLCQQCNYCIHCVDSVDTVLCVITV